MKSIKHIIAVALLVVGPSLAPAGAQTYPLECAQRDVQVVVQIEQYGEGQSVAGELLYEAFSDLAAGARNMLARAGGGGLALYDSIFKTSLAGQVPAAR